MKLFLFNKEICWNNNKIINFSYRKLGILKHSYISSLIDSLVLNESNLAYPHKFVGVQ